MKKIFVLALLIPVFLQGTEMTPWYGNDLEPHFRAEYLFQNYHKVNSSKGSESYQSNDHFLNVGIEGSYIEWQLEAEALFSDTRKHSFCLDSLKLTTRYQWLNDIIGDAITLTTGASFIAAMKEGLYDISSFHHGRFEGELDVSIGKEFSSFQYWTSRIWAVGAIGIADEGSPWVRGDFVWEKNWCDEKSLSLFVKTLWGVGGNSINIDSFSGYGSIDHSSVDIGARYTIQTECLGQLAIQYARRVHACNFPQHTNRITLFLLYPFWF